MGIFNEQSLDHPFARGIQGAPGVGFNLTSSGDYDMINKKLRTRLEILTKNSANFSRPRGGLGPCESKKNAGGSKGT